MKLTKETARKMYASNDESIKAFALDNYSKEELTKEELPKTWKELKKVNGAYVSEESEVVPLSRYEIIDINKNIFPTEAEAEASIALAQLCQLRDRYNGDWKADWTDDTNKHIIRYVDNKIRLSCFSTYQFVLNFKTADLRDEFLENFRELIEIAKPLL